MTAIQGDKQPFWQQTWFVESNWISTSTKWLLTFGGKAARIVLIICTLYMSAELYPGVSLPPGLNLAVFIILSFALDMGGLGLAQIAKTVRDQGNGEGAKQGEKLSKWLIGIMIAGLVTVSLEHAVDLISFLAPYKDGIAVFWIVVEIALSIARVICAVNYGHVIHALEQSVEDQQQSLQPVQNAASSNIQPVQAPIQPVQDTRIDAVMEEVKQLSALVLQMSQTVNVYVNSQEMDRDVQTHIQEIQEPVQQLPEVAGSIHQDEQEPDQTKQQSASEAPAVIYPDVAGIDAYVVKLVIDERLKGIAWSLVASNLGKNYTRVVKPIKEAYMAICTDVQAE
jgi:hypothetical protein